MLKIDESLIQKEEIMNIIRLCYAYDHNQRITSNEAKNIF